MTGLNRNQVVEILRLVCCENLICKRNEFMLDTFTYSELQCSSASHVRATALIAATSTERHDRRDLDHQMTH